MKHTAQQLLEVIQSTERQLSELASLSPKIQTILAGLRNVIDKEAYAVCQRCGTPSYTGDCMTCGNHLVDVSGE